MIANDSSHVRMLALTIRPYGSGPKEKYLTPHTGPTTQAVAHAEAEVKQRATARQARVCM